MADNNPFNARSTLKTSRGEYTWYDLGALEKQGVGHVGKLPYSIKVLLEAMLRNVDGFIVTADDVAGLASWNAKKPTRTELPFMPGRVVLQDFTGVPAIVDLAAMRDAMVRLGGDPAMVNPQVVCDLVIDHSVQVDEYGSKVALTLNAEKEFDRNRERYEFLKWGQQAFDNFAVVPPATGIVHQVNLEYLAKGVLTKKDEKSGNPVAYPDSLVGTDSHTTMINGLGVVGWGVGGIEAEACMLGQPIYMLTPEVIGFKLTGKLPEGATATDLVLTVTQMLRAKGVVDKFVEFFGDGIASMSVPDRATIANMAPEYGATMGFFPIDAQTLDYLRLTGRDEDTIELVEKYCKANGMFWEKGAPEPEFTDVLELDMGEVEPCLAGPRRPQDRITLSSMKPQWRKDLVDTFKKKAPSEVTRIDRWADEGGESAAGAPEPVNAPSNDAEENPVTVTYKGRTFNMYDGDVVIAAITSCTNTSNPDVMIAAGLLAKKANALGLKARPWVKTSLAPGSKVVTEYYDKANLTEHLEALGFHTVGYGCTTCIGNSGPLSDEISDAIREHDIVAASVLSGNRNFEGRINPDVRANYLASPPLVVAYAIAGTVDIDLKNDPIAVTKDGKKVYLKDIWPTHKEVIDVKKSCITPEQFTSQYGRVYDGNETWNEVAVSGGDLYEWHEKSTYIQDPPFFAGMREEPEDIRPIEGARCLVSVGDSVTTDHISPAGAIAEDSPAGKYLIEQGVPVSMFNSYGSRRGNDRVMTRGTFANIRIRNLLADGREGGWTRDFTDDKIKPVYDAAMNYKKQDTPLIVLAGKDYGMGSSRDWAAKGTNLLGVRAAIAQSYERIHRSNLLGMGVLPLQFKSGESRESHELDGSEMFDIKVPDPLEPGCDVQVTAHHPETGKTTEFTATCRIDTPVEAEYYRHGGILKMVLRRMLNDAKKAAAVG
ncbi:MAG: aconitate hydratase AcnA [Phycisphaeraceae bacterium]|nr:MAG: aconitate hydratase AcnA [Phycisphaeraceae bacterium]